MQLLGKTVLITGAAKRLGRAIALSLARRGASVLIHYNRSECEAKQLKLEIERLGREAHLISADFSSVKKPVTVQIQAFVKKAYKLCPRIDFLVNNAAVFYPTPFEKITERHWDDFMNVNLKVPFFLSQTIGKRMLRQKSGKIVNLVDWTDVRPDVNFIPYTISKAGLVVATRGLAKALAPHVQTIGIAPGPILPPKGMSASRKRKWLPKHCLSVLESQRILQRRFVFLSKMLII